MYIIFFIHAYNVSSLEQCLKVPSWSSSMLFADRSLKKKKSKRSFELMNVKKS